MKVKGNRFNRSLKVLKKEYYQWRYWNHLIKAMRKHMDHPPIKFQDQTYPYVNKPGIGFSFDDSFRINDWYTYGKDMFGYYDVKVTFNINASHHFEEQREHSQNEIDMLLELQSNGHEIAHHGYRHRDAVNYSNENGIENWGKDEVLSLINWMDRQVHSKTNEKFKKPVSFAFPYASYNDSIIKELVPKYFKIVRGSLYQNNLTPFNHTGFVPSICIDSNYLSNIKYIKRIMKMAKKAGSNLIFMCHSILPEEVKWEDFGWGEDKLGVGWWRTSPKTIQEIINEARNMGMEFYTISEIAGVATFIDLNFEKLVREHISKSSDKWILISDLSSIRELDLSNKNISNLDGIQYFLNLEKLTLSNNNVTNQKLLEKLPKLTTLEVSNNPIYI